MAVSHWMVKFNAGRSVWIDGSVWRFQMEHGFSSAMMKHGYPMIEFSAPHGWQEDASTEVSTLCGQNSNVAALESRRPHQDERIIFFAKHIQLTG